MDVRAAMVGAGLAIGIVVLMVAGIGAEDGGQFVDVRSAGSTFHMLMHEGVGLGELRRMQDRKLASAEHRHGEEHCDQNFS